MSTTTTTRWETSQQIAARYKMPTDSARRIARKNNLPKKWIVKRGSKACDFLVDGEAFDRLMKGSEDRREGEWIDAIEGAKLLEVKLSQAYIVLRAKCRTIFIRDSVTRRRTSLYRLADVLAYRDQRNARLSPEARDKIRRGAIERHGANLENDGEGDTEVTPIESLCRAFAVRLTWMQKLADGSDNPWFSDPQSKRLTIEKRVDEIAGRILAKCQVGSEFVSRYGCPAETSNPDKIRFIPILNWWPMAQSAITNDVHTQISTNQTGVFPIAPAVEGKRVAVVAFLFDVAGDQEITPEQTDGTNLCGQLNLTKHRQIVCPPADGFAWLVTAAGTGLQLNLSAAFQTNGVVVWRYID